MALQAGLLDTGLPTRVLGQTKIDLSTPTNMFTSLQANKRANQQEKRAQSLADLTLDREERAVQKQLKFQEIMKNSVNPNGYLDSEKAIPALYQAGFQKEAFEIEDRRNKARENRRALDAEMGNTFLNVYESENPARALLEAQKEGMEKGWKMSQGLMEYVPNSEELQDGRIFDKRVMDEMKYYGEKFLTPEQKIARAKHKKSRTLSQKEEDANLSFRMFLPSIDIENLSTDKNARNKLAKEILSRPDGNSPLAKETLKALKGGGSNFAEDIAKALAMQNLKGQNRAVPASQAVLIGGTADAINSIDKLMTVIPAIGGTDAWTPITDPINSLNPWNTRVQAKKQYIASFKQTIGKGLEGGVLRAEDEKKYEKIIPKMGDTLKSFQTKAEQLREMIVNKRKYMLQGLSGAGFNVENFKNIKSLKDPSFEDTEEEKAYKMWKAQKEAEKRMEQ